MAGTDTRPHDFARYVAGCRCTTCRQANVAYESNRRRQLAYGRWQPFVDAEPVRQHIQYLRAAGMGQPRIAKLAGVSTNTIAKLLYGTSPTRRVRPDTAKKLLAITVSLDLLGPSTLVDATGSQRRLQALVVLGWPQMELADRMGMDLSTFGRFMRGDMVQARNALRARELYEAMWNQAPPENNQRQRAAASRARAMAHVRGWQPPQAWDDDTIDDPTAGVQGGEPVDVDEVVIDLCMAGKPTSRPLTAPERLLVAQRVLKAGRGVSVLSQLLSCSGRVARGLLGAASQDCSLEVDCAG